MSGTGTGFANAVTISRATAEDRKAVSNLLDSVQLPTAGVAEHFDNFFVAKDAEGHLVGTIGLERYNIVGLLRSAAVVPSGQGTGVGSKLTKILIEFAKAEGLKELVLFTPSARDFFARFGFAPADRDSYRTTLSGSTQLGCCCASAEFMRLEL